MNFEKLLSIPLSFYVSWRLTSLKQALKLPILVRFDAKLVSLTGKVMLPVGGG